MKKVFYLLVVLILVSNCKINETTINKESIQPLTEVEKISKAALDSIRKQQLEDLERSELKRSGKASIFDIVYKKHLEEIPEFYGFRVISGGIVKNESTGESLSVGFIRKGNKGFITLEKSDYSDMFDDHYRISNVYTPNHQMLDTIQINNLRNYTAIKIRDCLVQGEKDASIVALIERGISKESYSDIKRVWKINFQTNKMEEKTNVDEITCIDSWKKYNRYWNKNRRK